MKLSAKPSSPKRFRELIVLNALPEHFSSTEDGLRELRKIERSEGVNGPFLRKLYASFSKSKVGKLRLRTTRGRNK